MNNLIIASIVFLFVFIFFISTKIIKEKYIKDIIQPLENTKILSRCSSGECAIDIVSGIKRCSSDGNQIIYNTSQELCTFPDTCPDKLPYSVGIDGETFGSVCDTPQCICSSVKTAAQHTTAVFSTSRGNLDTIVIDETLGYGNFTRILSNNEYGKINISRLNELGCDFKHDDSQPLNCELLGNCNSISATETPSIKNTLLCLTQNVCPSGQIAYNVDNKNSLEFGTNLRDPIFYTVSCSLGVGCTAEHTNDKSRFYPDFDICAYNPDEIGCSTINKTKTTLYYPVWNPNKYDIDCMRLKPALYSYAIVNNGSLSSIIVEYSGKDFSKYILVGGKYYYEGDTSKGLIINITGNGIGAEAHVSQIDNDGRIVSITIDNAGKNYSLPPVISVRNYIFD